MAPTAPNSDYDGLELVVEWLKAHSDSRNEVDELGNNEDFTNDIPPDAGTEVSTSAPVVANWLQASSDSRNVNEDDELGNKEDFTNEMPPDADTEATITVPIAAADSAARPRRQRRPRNTIQLDPNGSLICTYEGCGKTFGSTTALRRHERIHNPAGFHCEQCNYSTHRMDVLQSHVDRRHKQHTDQDYLKCQTCDYETYYKSDLTRHRLQVHEGRYKKTTDQWRYYTHPDTRE